MRQIVRFLIINDNITQLHLLTTKSMCRKPSWLRICSFIQLQVCLINLHGCATNLIAPIQLVRACLPHLRRQGGGRIVQASSEGGQVTYHSFCIYHATKRGIEGCIETMAQEVAPFGIDCVLVESGPTGTNFGANLDFAGPIAAYDATPAGEVRRVVATGAFPIKGDAARTVAAMIAAADEERPPLRLALGSAAYENIERALAGRLEAVRRQKAIALGADRALSPS